MNPIDIDLLPWRQAQREARRRAFYQGLGAAVLAAALVVAAGWWWLDALLARQEHRNQFLEQAIAQLDRELAEIKQLDAVIAGILGRKAVIEQLQTRRTEPIFLLDVLPRLLPEGVALTVLERQEVRVSLQGVARSNGTVSELMRVLEEAPHFRVVRLIETQATEVAGRSAVRFSLVAELDRDALARLVTSLQQPETGQQGGGR